MFENLQSHRGRGWLREEVQLNKGGQPHHHDIARKLRDPDAEQSGPAAVSRIPALQVSIAAYLPPKNRSGSASDASNLTTSPMTMW